MFFYDLPRFSIDLDFNLLDTTKEDLVYKRIRTIILSHGTIHDEARRFFGPILVLDYGMNERKLKVEISKRDFSDRYEIKSLMGQSIKVMVQEDLLAHKLCALLDRPTITNRDVFDIWFLFNPSGKQSLPRRHLSHEIEVFKVFLKLYSLINVILLLLKVVQ